MEYVTTRPRATTRYTHPFVHARGGREKRVPHTYPSMTETNTGTRTDLIPCIMYYK
jgi:hypothetical protein